MPADLSKSLVHSAEHFRTILVTVTAPVTAGTHSIVLNALTGLPSNAILLGIGPASAGDRVYSSAGVERTYVLSGVLFGASANTATPAVLTATGTIAAAKEINFAVTVFSPAGL